MCEDWRVLDINIVLYQVIWAIKFLQTYALQEKNDQISVIFV